MGGEVLYAVSFNNLKRAKIMQNIKQRLGAHMSEIVPCLAGTE